MKTFILRSDTNYGELIHIVNAEDEDDCRNIVLNNEKVWDNYTLEELNTETKGIVFEGGGDC